MKFHDSPSELLSCSVFTTVVDLSYPAGMAKNKNKTVTVTHEMRTIQVPLGLPLKIKEKEAVV